MKKYNYENLKEDEHVVPSLGILPIKISEDYNYIPKNIIFNLISDILIIPIVIILAVIAKIFLGFKVTGRENLVKDRSSVTISNHIHYIDCAVIGLINFPERTYFPTIEENFKIPFIRHLIKILHAIPIPKTKIAKEKFYTDIIEELENKEVALHMYPEGSLWPYYEKVRNFKYGAFKIATLANTPVVPIKFVLEKPTGIYELYKRKPCLHAYILPAIYPDENLEIKDRIADLKDEAERIMKES